MPAILWGVLIGFGAGGLGGLIVGARASNLAVMGASAATILYLIKGK